MLLLLCPRGSFVTRNARGIIARASVSVSLVSLYDDADSLARKKEAFAGEKEPKMVDNFESFFKRNPQERSRNFRQRAVA